MELRGTNLILHGVEKSDEGEYDCEIETDRSDPISIRHSIEILIPPSGRYLYLLQVDTYTFFR